MAKAIYPNSELDKLTEKGYIKEYSLNNGEVELTFPDGSRVQVWHSSSTEELVCEVIINP